MSSHLRLTEVFMHSPSSYSRFHCNLWHELRPPPYLHFGGGKYVEINRDAPILKEREKDDAFDDQKLEQWLGRGQILMFVRMRTGVLVLEHACTCAVA